MQPTQKSDTLLNLEKVKDGLQQVHQNGKTLRTSASTLQARAQPFTFTLKFWNFIIHGLKQKLTIQLHKHFIKYAQKNKLLTIH